jgi:anti-sigma B factor antagonist
MRKPLQNPDRVLTCQVWPPRQSGVDRLRPLAGTVTKMQSDREVTAAFAPDTWTMAVVRDHTTFTVGIETGPDPRVIRVHGELDSYSAGQLRDGIATTLGCPAVIIDIREVPFVDSAGLGALVGGIRRLRESGASVALCCNTASVRRLLAVTGFDRMVSTTDTLAEAEEVIAQTRAAG